MEELFDKIVESGILIGSRRWGGSKESSDYDVVISTPKTKKLLEYFEKVGIEYNNLGRTSSASHSDKNTMHNDINIKVLIAGKLINIISYKEKDIIKIKKLNEAIDSLKGTYIHESMSNNKSIRIKIIEDFLDILFQENSEVPSNKKNIPEINLDDLDFF